MITFVTNNTRTKTHFIPIHYINMAAFLESRGVPCHIVELKSNKLASMDGHALSQADGVLLDRIKKTNPRYVGLSGYTTEYSYLISLIKRIKEELPNVKVIIGGIHVTLRPRDLYASGAPVDLIVIGEGEFTLADIMAGMPLEEIPGIAFLKNGELVINKPRPLSKDLSHIPLPAYEKLDMDYYLSPSQVFRYVWSSGLHIFTSLGCPYSCTFCANPSLYKAQGAANLVRYKSVQQVIDDICHLKDRYGLEAFYFQDDTFTIKKDRVHTICDEIIGRKLNLLWATESRVNLLDDEMVTTMIRAGCRHIDLGVESGSQAALVRMKKGTKIEDVYNAFALLKRHGMRTGCNMLLDTPGETEKDVRLTQECMKKLKSTIYGTSLTVPFLGTEIYDRYVKPPLTIEEYKFYENPYLYSTIIDKRFRLSEHKLPIEEILIKVKMKYDYPRIFLDFPLKWYYLKYLLKSKYKFRILYCVFENLIYQLKNGFRFLISKFIKNRKDPEVLV